MLNLKTILPRVGRKQTELAAALELSPAAIAQLVNYGAWPRSLDEAELKNKIRAFLKSSGAVEGDIAVAFQDAANTEEKVSGPQFLAEQAARSVSPIDITKETNQENPMLLRKQTLHPATRKHFGLFRDPFSADVQSADDLFLPPDIRYVREAMLQTARFGGFLAIVAESGAGKTTLLRDLEDRILRDNLPIMLIRPYVLGMEDNDQKGKSLKSTHIAESIMSVVAPMERPKSSPEARFHQVHKVLKSSATAGYRHCLVIDEAHSLPIATIKHLKRFLDLTLGHQELISIILIGQPELKTKLSERDAVVREVVQRCEMVELPPIDPARLDEYLKHKFARLDKPLADVIDASGIDALRTKLMLPVNGDARQTLSLLYPLAVGNLLTAAMNLAAGIGERVVTADVVKGC